MSQHTPGPWRYEYEPGYCGELIAPDGMTIAAFIDEPRPYDARLIAAAPDLLKALILAASHIHTLTTPRAKADYSLIRAAIAKATGEAT